ncbi:hypothetical protein EUX98_g5120 [Antrodiella citrinella]|uniref:ATP-dependent DNA helicase n=1 Tax=Antrodiella citrinella TaxID=2447956 RepID=A0A4S4MSB1_9APHY|nr:hypothetical protein EUX98_g5120 [Antrodiella citrinella]
MAERLANSSDVSPRFGMCCNSGKVDLPLLPDPPQALKDLLDGRNEQSKDFREQIRQYNAALAFTSLGVQIDRSVLDGHGPYVFRIHGELCHRIGSLLPSENEQPVYAQLYIHDPRDALQQRLSNNTNLRADTMEVLQTLLNDHHQYARAYKHAFEVLQQQARRSDQPLDISIRLRFQATQDRRRYNLPTADEVAVVLPGDGEQIVGSRDIILHHRRDTLERMYDGHPAFAALHYVLLFPFGSHGWHDELRMRQPDRDRPSRVSQTRFYVFQLQIRPIEYSVMHRAGRLLQQYIVDSWAVAEQNRLRYLRTHQKEIRSALYGGLEDAVATADANMDNVNLNNLGQRFILPSSHNGSPRYMHQLFQDSLAIGRHYRKIDIFMTVTCNPDWPEITRELLPGQTPSDRPDLVARVFQMKKQAIMDDIFRHGVFGSVVAYVYTIEFQKRGLPHMHLLIFFADEFKLRNPTDIDSCIRAEWPDPISEPLLFETVKRCMVHGPCGPGYPNAPCMENNRCTKNFPKPFQDFTNMDDEGYPLYRRTDNPNSVHEVRGVMINNQWIVPYNPYFSAKYVKTFRCIVVWTDAYKPRYDCHINVECAVSFSSLKYVNKYIYKGHDRTTMEINQNDEIKLYIDARYVSSAESIWRIFHFPLHDRHPAVVRLQVHLPGQHLVTFTPDEDPRIVMERAALEQTTLTGFFAANAGPLAEVACRYTYQEFPQHFVWNQKTKQWTLRQQQFAIGRLYYVGPTAGERFYLRTLLTVVKGPRSFVDLRTVGTTVYRTFREACIARGLLADDGEWRLCLEEAAHMKTGYQLRKLFATILIFCNPTSPDLLWAEFRHHICDDLSYRLQSLGRVHPSEEEVFDYGLFLLDQSLQASGHLLQNFPPMPVHTMDWATLSDNRFISEQTAYDRNFEREALSQRLPQLNVEQRAAYDSIVTSVESSAGQLFFLNGPGGTGKTFVYNTVCNKVRSEGWIVLCVASSGIAALLLKGGRTAHSMFKIPIDGLNSDSTCAVPKQGPLAAMFRLVRLIVWDEITMQHRHAAEAVDKTLRDLRSCDRPFGGITVVFGGDFQQILPVVPNGAREEIVGASLQRSYLWPLITVLRLHRNMRLENDADAQDFAQWLLDVGHGRGTEADGTIHLPDRMRTASVDSLIEAIYPDIEANASPQFFLERIILAPRNNDVEDLNHRVLGRMPGAEEVYVAADSIVSDDSDEPTLGGAPIPVEFLRSLHAPGLPPGELRLKRGCPVILLRNLAPAQGLCNGTRMIVERMSRRVIEVRLIGGDHDGEIAFIPRIAITPSNSQGDFTFLLRRRQFPLLLAFAMTINKSQGQSVKHVGIDLRIPVFSHGQLYVALSRATSGHRIKVLLPNDVPSPTTLNVVYPEVLLD